jgi:hypothetical protein
MLAWLLLFGGLYASTIALGQEISKQREETLDQHMAFSGIISLESRVGQGSSDGFERMHGRGRRGGQVHRCLIGTCSM